MKKEKNGRKSTSIAIVIVTAVIISILSEIAPDIEKFIRSHGDAGLIAGVPGLLILIIVIAAAVSAAARKKRSRSPAEVRAAAHEPDGGKRKGAHSEAAPLKCTCAGGRQRYLDQTDMFLKNGLIDKNEWKIMHDRYMKMDFPEDM